MWWIGLMVSIAGILANLIIMLLTTQGRLVHALVGVVAAVTFFGVIISTIAERQQDKQNAERHEELLSKNRQLEDVLAPVVAAANSPGLGEGPAIKAVLDELKELRQLQHPKLIYLPDRTTQTRNAETGMYETIFIVRPEHPVVVRDAVVEFHFDRPVEQAECSVKTPWLGKDAIVIGFLPNKQGILANVHHLDPAGEIRIKTVSIVPIRLMKHILSPPFPLPPGFKVTTRPLPEPPPPPGANHLKQTTSVTIGKQAGQEPSASD